MIGSLVGEVVVIMLLTLANGLFAASEIAIVSARKGRLEQRAAQGRVGAVLAMELAENPNRFLSTVQVGITLVSTFAAAFGGASIARVLAIRLQGLPVVGGYAESVALVVVVVAISYLSLIVGELVPKRLALQRAEGVAVAVAPMMMFLARLVGPVIHVLTFSTELVLRVLGQHKVAEVPVSEDDIMALVREGAAEGTVEAAEEDLITSVFTFTDRSVRSLMTPRTQVVAVEVQTPLEDVLAVITRSGYSRIPVYQGTLDQVVGVLYVKDLLQAWGQPAGVALRSLLRPPQYVLEGQRAVVVFQQLKQHRSALAIVLDEYGQVAGLISMEDLLEEIVGDIADEYDEVRESIVRREDGSYLVDGLLAFDDLRGYVALPLDDVVVRTRSFETVAGLVLVLLGRIPRVGDRVVWGGYRFEVVDMDGRRIDKILIELLPGGAGGEEATSLGGDKPLYADESALFGRVGDG